MYDLIAIFVNRLNEFPFGIDSFLQLQIILFYFHKYAK